MMNKYRIGRIAGPWVNFTPPIRGGIYRDNTEPAQYKSEDEDGDDAGSYWSSCQESLNSSTTSLDSITNGDLSHSAIISSRLIKGLDQYSAYAVPDRDTEGGHISSNAQGNDHQGLSPKQYTSYAVQKAIDDDVRDNPSLDAETQRAITLKYQILHQRVKAEGFYDCHYIEYGKEIMRYTILFSLFITFLRAEWYLTSACFLGLFWHQIMFTAHDAGHRGITHNFVADTMIGIFIADFCCGLSIGWWKSSHNVHHLVTNHPVCNKTPDETTC